MLIKCWLMVAENLQYFPSNIGFKEIRETTISYFLWYAEVTVQ